LEKVREIRRAIRRRYGNRKNFQKIFNLWDEDSNGAVSVRNMYNMISRMGLNINVDEARVLVASSDKDGSGDLALDEFLELIFNENDALNVNLAKIPGLDVTY
jgi:Ca2+-binding EF-hand superfamily protein